MTETARSTSESMQKRWWRCFARVCLALSLSMPLADARAQSIAFTFDDPVDPQVEGQADVGQRIRDALQAKRIKATVFVCGMRIDSPTGIAELRSWSTAGHEIANHTYSHQSLSNARVTAEAFIEDALKNEQFLRENALRPVRFRFPYLKEGQTRDKRDAVRRWLRQKGYRSGAVSIDASDWYYDQRYRAWRKRNPTGDDAVFKEAYLAHLWNRANYYDGLSRAHLGRSVRHTLLLHVNEINARFMPDIIAMFERNGWRIIDTKTAYRDPVYQRSPQIVPAGESLLWQISKGEGNPALRVPGEDGQYEQPILDALGL